MFRKFAVISIVFSFIFPSFYSLQVAAFEFETPIISYKKRFVPTISQKGMVASQERLASEVGVKILQQGGNAIDAAVAVGFALAVTLPQAGNLGGGGFMLVHLAAEGRTIALDYREMAPKEAHKDMFLNDKGNVDNEKAQFSRMAAGVPGTVAGLTHALKNYGTMSLKQVMQPAIDLAINGFEVSYTLGQSLNSRHDMLSVDPETEKVFFGPGGGNRKPGELLIQSDLAWSLTEIMKKGESAFYKGAIADKIVKDMSERGGLITYEDLAAYKVVERSPIIGQYKGYKIATMPPPSSGGIHLVQMLNMLSGFDLKNKGHNSAATLHLLIESMRQAYADRSKYLGDPDFFDVPVEQLISQNYADRIRSEIPSKKARKSIDISPGLPQKKESPNTTHYSVMDKQGNVVSNTYTLNFSYGSGLMVKGAGFLLNNEMDDFSAKPGSPNGYGLIGGEANAIEPKKRPLSSMTPTIVFKNDQPLMATGSPGGSTIITVVLQTILNVLEFDMNIAEATAAPRIHHQWLPDEVALEHGVSKDTVNILNDMGHNVYTDESTLGSTQSIMYIDGFFYGSSDPRRPGAAAIGYD